MTRSPASPAASPGVSWRGWASCRARVLLWGLQKEKEGVVTVAELPEPPGQGLTSVEKNPAWPEGFCQVCGYMDCGPRVVRVDMLERLGDMIRERVFWKPRFDGEERPAGSVEGGGFVVIPDMMSLVGCSGDDFSAVLKALGYRAEKRPAPKAEAASDGNAVSDAETEGTAEEEGRDRKTGERDSGTGADADTSGEAAAASPETREDPEGAEKEPDFIEVGTRRKTPGWHGEGRRRQGAPQAATRAQAGCRFAIRRSAEAENGHGEEVLSRRRRDRSRPPGDAAPLREQRADKWLWCVRICRTRAEAARIIGKGQVRINRRKISRPSALVRMDDVLTVARNGHVRVVRVAGFASRRLSPRAAAEIRLDLEETDGPENS